MEALRIDSVVEFFYPAANYRGARFRWERRRLLVEKVRDLTAEPLDPMTVQLDPELRRGRVLVTGQDLDRLGERSFYVDSMRNVRQIEHDGSLDTLPVAFGRPEGTVRVSELPDPRSGFCEAYNALKTGLVAQPVSRATVLASSNLRSE